MSLQYYWRFMRHFWVLIGFGILYFIVAGLSTPFSHAQGNVTTNPSPHSNYLTNPSIGWHQKNLGLPQMLPETVDYIGRRNISWDILNPADDIYDWTVLDNAILAAQQADKQVAFRVYTMQIGTVHHVPNWVLTKGAVITPFGFPDYNNCTYQQEWAEFVDAMRVRYDGNPAIAYIDISGYGDFNEWGWINQNTWTKWESDYNNPTTLDGQARRRLADMYIGGTQASSNCVDNLGIQQNVSYNYTGFQATQLLMPYAGIRQSTWYVHDRRTDVGFRHDSLGSPTHDIWTGLSTTLEDIWRTAPVVYELGDATSTDEPFFSLADTLLRQSHATMVGDNFNVTLTRDSARTETLMSSAGYRYQLISATHPSAVAIGQDFTVGMNWWNVGYAPAYPLMGHDFTAHFYVINAQGQTVADFPLPTAVESWMPANDIATTSTENPPDNLTTNTWTMPNLAAGIYFTAVGIVHNPTGNHINLGINGRDIQGRYQLNQIRIEDVATPTSTNTATSTPTHTATPTSTATPTNTPTMTATPTNTSANTAAPTNISTSTGTQISPPDALTKTPDSSTIQENALNIAAQVSRTPQINGLDIRIQNTGSPGSVQLDGTVIFTITITNPNSQALPNVVMLDDVPELFEIIEVLTTQGQTSINRNRVLVDIGTIQAQQTITITIITEATQVGFAPDTCNSANIGGGVSNQSCPNIFPRLLPQTGESPFGTLRLMLLAMAIVAAISSFIRFAMRRKVFFH